jgi:hypothetical protein
MASTEFETIGGSPCDKGVAAFRHRLAALH